MKAPKKEKPVKFDNQKSTKITSVKDYSTGKIFDIDKWAKCQHI